MDEAEQETMNALLDADDPIGVWQGAPSLAASTVVMTNTSGHPVVCGVSGGTVTAVVVNGVTLTAITSGRFRLRRTGTIAITYSVAPTLQWVYE